MTGKSDTQARDVNNAALVDAHNALAAGQRAERALREETQALELINSTGMLLSSKLDLESLLQAITDSLTKLTGAAFGAFFYNVVGDEGEEYQLYTLSGAPREAFEKFGKPRATPLFGPTFRGERPIRIDDVLEDPRYGQWAPHHGMPAGHLPVRSYLALPVISRCDEVHGGLFFGHPEPGIFTQRAERISAGVAAQAAVAIDNARLYERVSKAAEERQALLERERIARSHAEHVSALKDEFLANLSHELRTPLNAILGWAQVLRRMPDRNASTLSEGLAVIERNTRAQAQLIEDLLDVSRISSGKVRLDVQPLMPVTTIEAALASIRPAAEAKGVRIETVLDSGAGPVAGDAGRLQQVLWNLLSNAVKFTPKAGRVQVQLRSVDSSVEIAVADTGMGMSEAFQQQAFERFRQADASSTRQYGGLGLGLSIVKNLVELHGGQVHAQSPGEGKGSTFIVRLPISIVSHPAFARESVHFDAGSEMASTAGYAAPDLSGITVLVVEDEADSKEVVRRVLAECSAHVVTAANAIEALEHFSRGAPDVLVSDIGMPDLDGYELLRRVRRLERPSGRRVPAVALTAFARSEDRTRALNAGFLVHLAKPVQPSELVATVASVTGRIAEC